MQCRIYTCIDNIFIQLDKIAYRIFILHIPLIGHFPLFMSINKLRTIENIDTIKHKNYNKLRTATDSINWSELSLINDPNLGLNNLIDKIKMCLCKAEYKIKTNENKNMRISEKLPTSLES